MLPGGRSLIIWALDGRIWTKHRYVWLREWQGVEREVAWEAATGPWMALVNHELLYDIQLS